MVSAQLTLQGSASGPVFIFCFFSTFLAGILPFGAMFIELFFIFTVHNTTRLLSLEDLRININIRFVLGHMGESVLLPVRVPFPGVCHSRYQLCSNICRRHLLPAVF